jgi:hypothetical protein
MATARDAGDTFSQGFLPDSNLAHMSRLLQVSEMDIDGQMPLMYYW